MAAAPGATAAATAADAAGKLSTALHKLLQFIKLSKASQSFTSADVKAVKSVFCRDLCVAEYTLHGASVELFAVSGQPRHRAQ